MRGRVLRVDGGEVGKMGGRVLRADVDFLWGGAMVYGVGGFGCGGTRKGCAKMLCELAGGEGG